MHQVFDHNMAEAALLNAKDSTARFGMSPYADLTPQEFKSVHSMAPLSTSSPPLLMKTKGASRLPAVKQSPSALPRTFDWRDQHVIASVFNEGQCGSTWAVAVVDSYQSVCAIHAKR